MAGFFSSLGKTIIAGVVILIAIILAASALTDGFRASDAFIMRWLHVMSGVMWIGLLWYFNFVQTPSMAQIPDEQKPAVSKVIAPRALFWFRWAAMATLITGIILAGINGYLVDALLLGTPTGQATLIGVGVWLAIIMWFNVWFIIWPNQKKVLGIVTAEAAEKAAAAKRAGLASRLNTMLSIPMLYFMVAQSHGGIAF